MVVIKTASALKRVFVKQVTEDGEPASFRELEFESAAASRKGPVSEEEVNLLIEEKLAEARGEWEEELAAKTSEAFEKGRLEGADSARDAIDQRAKELAGVISSLAQSREMILRQAHTAVIDLSLAIARKIVGSLSVLNSDLIKNSIKSAVKMVTEKDKVTIRINPDDREEVRAHQDDIIFVGDGIGRLEIISDKKIDRGGCVVETEAGNIDARIESRFAEIEKSLRQALSSQMSAPEDALEKSTDE